jgi:hypothetical protein
MSATETSKIRRKSRPPTSFAGKHLVFGELKERGFDAQLGPREHEMIVRAGHSPPMRIQVKTTHSTLWYVRHTSFVGSLANEVTVFVLLGSKETRSQLDSSSLKIEIWRRIFAWRRIVKVLASRRT